MARDSFAEEAITVGNSVLCSVIVMMENQNTNTFTEERRKRFRKNFGGDNRKVSEETKLKIRKYMAGNNPMKNPEVVKKVAQKNTGRHYSEESNKRKSEAHKKRILCVELDKIYNSRNEAAKEVGVDASNISRAAKGETQTSGGYHWRYV